MAYFQKILLSSPLRTSDGKDIPWEKIGTNTGVLKTDDEALIAELQSCIKSGFGGVSEIDEAKYEDLKKNLPKRSRPQFGIVASGMQEPPKPLPAQSQESSEAHAAAPSPTPKSNRGPRADKPATSKGVFSK